MRHDFDILEYGACAGGAEPSTAAIQSAIDACHRAGGGRVFCGAGTWVTGALELRSRVELHLSAGCRIVGSPRLADYTPLVAAGFHTEISPERSSESLIRAVNAEGIAITGPGTIDGSGLAFYDIQSTTGKLEKPATPRPRIGMFYQCRGIRIEDTTFVDSPCWTLWLMQCEGARIHGISIGGNRRMRNMDGIDVDACSNVTISDCRIHTEDDCIVLRSMRHLYDSPAVCENVTVTNCVLSSSCQGVRVGCPGDGVIRRCTLSNLTIQSECNGIVFDNPRVYLRAGSPGSADISDILFSNCVIHCGLTPIKVSVEEGIALPRLAHLSFSDFRIHSGRPCLVQGSPETIIRDVRFSNMQIETSGEDALLCRYCRGVNLSNVELSNRAEPPA